MRAWVYNYVMGKITDIAPQKRNRSRVSVFIDGDFVCGLDAVTAAAARIKIGDEISADELLSIVRKSEVNSAFERGVSYLSRVPRSRKEILRHLIDKGYDKDVASEALERLDAYHYTDDRVYADSYIRSKSKNYGKFRLQAELRQKGVDSEIIDELLDENEEDGTAAARKYMRTHPNADVNKLKRYLAGHGYSWDAISTTVSNIYDEYFSDSADDEY